MKTVDPKSLGISSERLKRLDKWLEEQITGERFAGCSLLFARRGDVAYFNSAGHADAEKTKPFQEDTIVRLFSMTKPITSLAAMMLYEQNCFQLDDPLWKYIPDFYEMQVWKGGDLTNTEPAEQPITIHQLFTHTSGLTYGFMQSNVVDERYRELEIDHKLNVSSLAQWTESVATIPLMSQPGTQWNYSISTDVLGRLVEIWSGESLADFCQKNIFDPLKMVDTGFRVPESERERFADLFIPSWGAILGGANQRKALDDKIERKGIKLQEAAANSPYFREISVFAGGGGLASTISDYSRFCQMMMNKGELDGQRLLSKKTVEYMMSNHLPDNRDIAATGDPAWSETGSHGIGFGLGGAVVIDPVKAETLTSVGEYHWGGAASTVFWIDPLEDLYVIFISQLLPSSSYPIRRELRTRIYQTLID